MRIFITGATGFVGSALVVELINAGHQVIGMARSEAGAQALAAAGAQVHRGDLGDLESLRQGAALSDGVIHTAFNHDFSKFLASCAADRGIIEALGGALAGSSRPLIVTSAIAVAQTAPGQPAVEGNPAQDSAKFPRAATEEAAAAVAALGVNVSMVRLSQVHDTLKQGLVTELVKLARATGSSAYVGEGGNRWSAAPLGDVARLYRLALEKQQPGAVYHAVAEEGVPLREIAEVVARGLRVPALSIPAEQVAAHFGWLAKFAALDMRASSAQTRERLGWHPTGPGLIADLEQMRYTQA